MLKFAQSPSRFIRICLEGNIACGKTSVLNYLSQKYGFADIDLNQWNPRSVNFGSDHDLNLVLSPEPINRWTNVAGTNLLELMYNDSERWSFTFEHFSQFTRFEQMKKVYDLYHNKKDKLTTLHLMERSIFSNRFCFVENFHQSGQMSPVEYAIIDQWFSHLMSKPEVTMNQFIYLRTSPQTVWQRIQKRSRQEEDTLPPDYLHKLHQCHEKLFDQMDSLCWSRGPSMAKVVVIDANLPLEDVCRQVEKNIAHVAAAI